MTVRKLSVNKKYIFSLLLFLIPCVFIAAPTPGNKPILGCPNDKIISAQGNGVCDIDNFSGLPYWWGPLKMNAPDALKKFSVTGINPKTKEGWTIAIINDGYDPFNVDTKNKLWVNKKEIPGNRIDDDKNSIVDDVNGAYFPMDPKDQRALRGRGDINTWNSQSSTNFYVPIIAGTPNNIWGGAGLAPSVKFMYAFPPASLSSFPLSKLYPLSDIEPIKYAIVNGAKIIVVPAIQSDLNFTQPGHPKFKEIKAKYEEVASQAVAKGAIILTTNYHLFLSASSNAITIGDTDGNDKVYPERADTTYISKDGIYAPGIGIHADLRVAYPPSYDANKRGIEKKNYQPIPETGGIAFAAGTIALMLELNPDLDLKTIKKILFDTGANVPNLPAGKIGRRIDLLKALSASKPAASCLATNPVYFADVNGDCFVSPLDVLSVINALNSNTKCVDKVFLDTNADKDLTPLDSLVVINDLNSKGSRKVCNK